MGINRDLCSLKKNLTPQNSKLKRNTRNHVIIFQNCYLQNPITLLYSGNKFTITLQQQQCEGRYCLKITILYFQVLFLFVFSVIIILPLLLSVYSPTVKLPQAKCHLLRLLLETLLESFLCLQTTFSYISHFRIHGLCSQFDYYTFLALNKLS